MAEAGLADRARAILEYCSTMTLATSGPEGVWAADVFFASAGLGNLYFISSPNSLHSRNALASGVAAATVHPEAGSDWRAIRGLQMDGELRLAEERYLEIARSVYLAKFPFAAALLGPESEVAAKTSGTRFFALRVRRLYLVDNSLGFGKRQEIEMVRTED